MQDVVGAEPGDPGEWLCVEKDKHGGHTVIESKKAMRARGMKSPERAEVVLLAVYEPEPIIRRGGGLLV